MIQERGVAVYDQGRENKNGEHHRGKNEEDDIPSSIWSIALRAQRSELSLHAVTQGSQMTEASLTFAESGEPLIRRGKVRGQV